MSDEVNTHTAGGGKSFYDELDELRGQMAENLRYTKSLYEIMPKDAAVSDKQFREFLADYLYYAKANYALLLKIHRWVIVEKILAVIKIVLIAVPIILGVIYLPPFIIKTAGPYLETLKELQNMQRSL